MSKRLIFVFGSNLAGRHGAGAARHAFEFCGAEMGVGVGLTGRSYAIPTKNERIQTMYLDIIAEYIEQFIGFAKHHPELNFQVTPIGCGLAGYRQDQIRPLFCDMPDNCFFSAEWLPSREDM